MRWRSCLAVALGVGCLLACGESKRSHERKETPEDAGITDDGGLTDDGGATDDGGTSCNDRLNAAAVQLLRSRAAHGACASDDECVLVPEDGACFASCEGAVRVGEEAAFAAELVELSDEHCAGPSDCTLWRRPGRCPTARPYCDPELSLCSPGCVGALDFLARDGADGTCGGALCPALPDTQDPRFEYRMPCCTDSGACGSGSAAVFGGACFEREQPGTSSEACPSGSVFLYIDLGSYSAVVDSFPGCCRPDGQCGLDTSATVGAGCVERSVLSAAVESGCSTMQPLETFESMPCAP